MAAAKFFNITGICDPMRHYMLPALPRLPDVFGFIDRKEYFLLHAPRQSGKTTSITAVVDSINSKGECCAVYCSLEQLVGQSDEKEAMAKLFNLIWGAFEGSTIDALRTAAKDGAFLSEIKAEEDFAAFPVKTALSAMCGRLGKDLAIFFDEADTLAGQPLLSFLSQLRAGFMERDKIPFPSSIVLVGLRNLQKYNAQARPDSESLGAPSHFNIISESLTMKDFTLKEIEALYAQHAEATGQSFENEAIQRAWWWSEGQPWLVNALARNAVMKQLGDDRGVAITARHIDQAAKNLMRERPTHVDTLLKSLFDPRVKRFLEPALALSESASLKRDATHDADLQYCLDLGLVKGAGAETGSDVGTDIWPGSEEGATLLRPANHFYANAIVRYLGEKTQKDIPKEFIHKWMDKDAIHMTPLLKGFQKYWAEQSERHVKGLPYVEAGPHLLLSCFLLRVVNGGADVYDEYALGLGRCDIVVSYAGQNYPVELKIKDNQKSKAKSRQQLLGYMDHLGADEGWLLIFDRKSKKSWKQKLTWETEAAKDGRTIHWVGF